MKKSLYPAEEYDLPVVIFDEGEKIIQISTLPHTVDLNNTIRGELDKRKMQTYIITALTNKGRIIARVDAVDAVWVEINTPTLVPTGQTP